ncbi:MAG TPA: hypothetical protein VKI17_05480 [Gemmataceae bacterium]|nr:hypothetical protein [Gemmataceae bacterium]
MKHVAKQDWMGCAVATAAMLADLTYEEVAARPLLPDLARTRRPRELRALLAGLTGSEWRVTTFWFRRPVLAHYSLPDWPVAVFLQDAPFRPRLGQWVVVQRELVHDPGERTVYTVSKYPRRDWRIASLARPRRPAAFAGEQACRRIDRMRQVLQMEMLSLAEPVAAADGGRDSAFS